MAKKKQPRSFEVDSAKTHRETAKTLLAMIKSRGKRDTTVDGRFDNIDGRLDSMDGKLDALLKQGSASKTKGKGSAKKSPAKKAAPKKKTTYQLLTEIDKKVDDFKQDLGGKIDDLGSKVAALGTEVSGFKDVLGNYATKTEVQAIGDKIDALAGKVATIDDLTGVKNELGSLKQAVANKNDLQQLRQGLQLDLQGLEQRLANTIAQSGNAPQAQNGAGQTVNVYVDGKKASVGQAGDDDLVQENNQLKGQAKRYQAQIRQLQDDLQQNADFYSTDRQKYQKRVEDAQKLIDGLQDNIANLEKQMQDIRNANNPQAQHPLDEEFVRFYIANRSELLDCLDNENYQRIREICEAAGQLDSAAYFFALHATKMEQLYESSNEMKYQVCMQRFGNALAVLATNPNT